jgi:hypothetical protein
MKVIAHSVFRGLPAAVRRAMFALAIATGVTVPAAFRMALRRTKGLVGSVLHGSGVRERLLGPSQA